MHDDCLNVNQQLENLSRKFVKRIGLLRHITPYLIERLRYPGSVYGYEQCHLVLLMSVIRSYFFCFLAIDNDIIKVQLYIDENIANQNHATRTRVHRNRGILTSLISKQCTVYYDAVKPLFNYGNSVYGLRVVKKGLLWGGKSP
jgi:hypothetical protein